MNYNSDMEESVLSCIFKDPALLPVLEGLIESDDFYWYPYKNLWNTFLELEKQSKQIDLLTVSDEMNRSDNFENFTSAVGGIKGNEALKLIRDKEDCDPANAETYALNIKEDTTRRKLEETFNNGVKWVKERISPTEILNNMEREFSKVSSFSSLKQNNILSMSDAVMNATKATEAAHKGGGSEIKTGLTDLDELIGGLFGGDQVIVSGRAGEGKTALLLTIVANATYLSKRPKKVAIFSMEMNNTDVVNRFISQMTGLSATKLRKGDIKDEEWDDYYKASSLISLAKIHIDDTPALTIPEMRAKTRKIRDMSGGLDMIVVDQLNLMTSQIAVGSKEFEKINWLSYRLKQLAREFNVPILVAHQMNRGIEQNNSRDPQLSDLEMAGEKSSDVVLMIRHKKEQSVIKESFVHVTKNRNGSTGATRVQFIANRVRFENAVKGTYEETPNGF